MPTLITLPQAGKPEIDGIVTHWLRKVGETVTTGQPLLEIKTGQGMVIVPSPVSGVLLRTMLSVGTRAGSGTPLAWVGSPGEEAPLDLPSFVVSSTASIASEPEPAPVVAEEGEPRPFISPVVARMAREYGIDLHQVQGTGQDGRITRRDLEEFVQSRNHARPVRTSTAPAPEISVRPASRVQPLSAMQKYNAGQYVFSQQTIPQGSLMLEVDLRQVLAHQSANRALFSHSGAHLTLLPYLLTACAAALQKYPLVNASWMDNGVLLHSEINIGIQTPIEGQGAIIPVLRGVNEMTLLALARAAQDLQERAVQRDLKAAELKGGTFSVLHREDSAALACFPLVNPPECAALCLGAVRQRPVVADDAIAIRPLACLSLSFDQRILDFSLAENFTADVAACLENWK